MRKEIITDEEIENAFKNTSFGDREYRGLLEQGVLKKQAGYGTGHTLEAVMIELGLLTYANKNVSSKGKKFLYRAFYSENNQG